MEIVGKILRFVIAFIDSGIVWVIRTIYNLFYNLSDLMLYSEKIIESLGQRIGLILGIFMLFRLAVSLVTYMISPEKLTDNAKGGGKLIVNVIVSLVLLATVNLIFVQAYRIQDAIIRSGFIEKIFFGAKVDTETRQKLDISYYLYTPLFQPNAEVFGDDCKTLWDPSTKIEEKDEGRCDQKLFDFLGDDRRAVYRAYNSQDMSYVLSNFSVVTAKQNGEWVFDYKIVAPAAGVVCALVLISFSMDLATRAIKLLFLQIIAPIPIISNIDPNKGQEIFKKWYQECFKTYVSVFLRVITINFAVYIITVILTEFDQKNVFASDPLITVALIIGALIFAKQVPKLIENIFGIKMEGSMSLNPLKKFENEALFGKQILGFGKGMAAAGLAGSAAMGANFINGIYSSQDAKGFRGALKGLAKGVGSGLAGGLSAAGRGTVGAFQGKKFNDIYKSSYGGAIKARNNRADRQSAGINSFDIMGNQVAHALGAPTEAEIQDANIKFMDEFTSSADSAISISEGEIDKTADKIQLAQFDPDGGDVIYTDNAGHVLSAGTYNTLAELREAMSDQSKTAAERAAINAKYNKLRGDIAKEYRNAVHDNSIGTDARFQYEEYNSSTGVIETKQIFKNTDTSVMTVKAHLDNIEDIYSKHKTSEAFEGLVSAGKIDADGKIIDEKAVTKQVKYVSAKTKNSQEYRRAHAIQQQAQKEGK